MSKVLYSVAGAAVEGGVGSLDCLPAANSRRAAANASASCLRGSGGGGGLAAFIELLLLEPTAAFKLPALQTT